MFEMPTAIFHAGEEWQSVGSTPEKESPQLYHLCDDFSSPDLQFCRIEKRFDHPLKDHTMSSINQKTAAEVYRAYMQHQVESANEMGGLALECIGKLSALNMKFIANSIATSSGLSQQSLGTRTPSDLVESAAAQLPVRAEENIALSRDYVEAIATMNSGFVYAAQQHAIRLNKQITEALQKQTRTGDQSQDSLGTAWASGTADIPGMIFQMVEAGRKMSETWNDNMRNTQAQMTNTVPDTNTLKEKTTSRQTKS